MAASGGETLGAEVRVTAGPGQISDGRRRMVAWLLTAGVLVVVAYWVTWFVDRSVLASVHNSAYYQFEDAFPLADGWLAACMAVAAVQVVRRRASALLWLLAGAGAGAYLAGMDVLYDIEHAIWFRGGGGLVELVINVVTVTASATVLVWAWRRRQELLAGT